MIEDINVFKRRYEREKLARIEAESILESKSRELYLVNEQLKSLTADLENIINERTAELKLAHDQAIASSQAKSLFLANMSHEIRTPMNGVLGVLHLLQKTPLNQRQKQLMDTAKSSGELLLAIINDILDVSKIEAGELVLEEIDFDLPRLLITMLDSFSHEADKKSLQLLMNLASNLPRRVKGDPTRLRQVISNLLSNAIKFTTQGHIKLTAEIAKTPDNDELERLFPEEGNWIRITVSDTGIGIPAEKINHIFSPFTQADESITRQYGGTGLGLAICSHLTEAMGQRIKVSSILHKGTEFSFLLYAPEKSPNLSFSDDLTEYNENSIHFHGGHIMLVDDNPVNREIAQAILEEHGLKVSPFENGLLAVNALENKEFDLILMDIQMPVMDGITATKTIRSSTLSQCKIPIIAMTAHAAREDITKSLTAGMNGHLTKPIQPEKLVRELSQWLAHETKEKPKQVASKTPQISGLVVEEALQRANNNVDLFNKITERFSHQHQYDIRLLQEHFGRNQFADIQKIAHKLKGSSLSIGAKDLAEAAHNLESCCKRGTPELSLPLIDLLDQQLTKVFSAIADYQSTLNTQITEPRIQNQPNKHDFEIFYSYCNSDLKKAEDAFNRIIQSIPPSETARQLQLLFDQFDMEAVNTLLKKIESNLFNHITQA